MQRKSGGAVAIMVKTPGYSPIKTRLADEIGRNGSEAFYRHSFGCVGALVKQACAQSSEKLTPYWAIAEDRALSHPFWQGFERLAQGEGGNLGERLGRTYEQLLNRHSHVIIIGSDAPHVLPSLVMDMSKQLASGERFLVGPAEDGGFYIFGGSLALPVAEWEKVTYGDYRTYEMFSKMLGAHGPVREVAGNFDIDTSEDLVRLKKLLASRKDLLNEQKGMLKWLGEAGY